MNKKLVSLAVAAAIAAPTAAMAEAVLYGKLHVSIDYQNVDNVLGNSFEEVDVLNVTGVETPVNTITNIYSSNSAAKANGGPGSDGFVAQARGVDAWTNLTGGTVYVPLEDGTVARVTNRELLTGVTSSVDGVPMPVGDVATFIRVDSAGNPIIDKTGSQDYDGWGINGRSSKGFLKGAPRSNRIGVKGSEDLGNGLKAIYQVEFGVQLADTNGNIASGGDNVTMRNSFVGLAGDWGTFLVGRHDTPLKISTGKLDLFSDTMADYNGTVGFQDIRADNAIAYISPSFSGFSFAGAVIAPGGTYLGGQNINADSLAEAYSLALIYNNGPFYASAAYESIGNDMYMDSATSLAGKSACLNDDGTQTLTCNYVEDDFTKWRLGLGILDWNGFTLTGIYEQQDDLPSGQTRQGVGFIGPDGSVTFGSFDSVKNQTLWQIQAGYAFGNNMFKAMYGAVDRDNTKAFTATRDTVSLNNIRTDLSGDRETWAVGFDHNFSKRTKAYVLYTAVTDDRSGIPNFQNQRLSSEWSGFSLGMIHKF